MLHVTFFLCVTCKTNNNCSCVTHLSLLLWAVTITSFRDVIVTIPDVVFSCRMIDEEERSEDVPLDARPEVSNCGCYSCVRVDPEVIPVTSSLCGATFLSNYRRSPCVTLTSGCFVAVAAGAKGTVCSMCEVGCWSSTRSSRFVQKLVRVVDINMVVNDGR